jgi:hypothetical protein
MRNPFRWLIVVLSGALCAALLWGAQQRRVLIRENVAAAADRQAVVDMGGKLRDAEKARLAAEAALQGQGDIRRMFPESRSVPASGNIDKFNAEVDSDPVWEPFFRKLERRRVLSRYDILLTALKIPQDKLAPLQELLVERAITTRYIVHQLRNGGQKFNSPEVIAAVSHATEEVGAKITKLIGGDLANKLKEWNSAIYSYGSVPDGPVAQDAVTLKEAGFELSTDQLVMLALIRYEVYVLNPEARSGSGADQVDPKTGLSHLEEQLSVRQAEVLSADEIAVLRNWAIEEHKAKAALDVIRAKYHVEADRAPRSQN